MFLKPYQAKLINFQLPFGNTTGFQERNYEFFLENLKPQILKIIILHRCGVIVVTQLNQCILFKTFILLKKSFF